MIKKLLCFGFFLISLNSQSQEYPLPEDIGDEFVFFKSFDNKIHLLKNNIDYVFENKKWVKKTLEFVPSKRDSLVVFLKKGFNNTNFKTINFPDKTYFVLNGGGPVLTFDNKSLIRVDNSVEQRNQFGSALFSHDNKIFMYGGYGFWTYKDYLTYFDFSSNQWELYKLNPENKFIPEGRWKPVFHKTKDTLYVLGGKSSLLGNTLIDRDIKDVFIIDFVSNTIKPVNKQINPNLPLLSSSNNGFEFDGQKAYLTIEGITLFNFKKNQSTTYSSYINGKNIFKHKKQNTPVLSLSDSIVFIKDKQNIKTLSFISKEKILKSSKKTTDIFITQKAKTPYKKIIAISSAFFIVIFLFNLFSYKDYLNKFILHDEFWLYFAGNKIMITDDQSKIIKILESKGEFSSLDLNSMLSKKKIYAKSHLTFLRQSFIEELNSVYNKLTGDKEDLINSKKNPIDKRQIIYFTGKKISKKASFFQFVFKKRP
jgi:hypothetical protein